MYIYWQGLTIPSYGLMIVLGIGAGSLTGFFLVRRYGLSTDDFILCAAYTGIGGFVGAKLLYLFVMRDAIEWNRLLERDYFQAVMSGGFVFYGGLIGGIFALWAVGKCYRIETRKYLELCIPALPLMHGFGRIGCGLAGCCYGIPYQGMFHIIYHAPSAAPLETALFPVQYLEAALNFLIALGLFFLVWKKGPRPLNLIYYIIAYGVIRFFLEYLRYDAAERGMWGGLSTSQWISLALCAVCAAYLIISHRSLSRTRKLP